MTNVNKPQAIEAFVAKKAQIDEMLARLQEFSDEHFNVSPDEVTWTDVSTLEAFAYQLKEITDCAFRQGEYAE